MAYRNLLVHVDATAEGRSRLANTFSLAKRLGASVTGVGAAAFEPHTTQTRGLLEDTLKSWVDEEIESARAQFLEVAGDAPGAEWRSRLERPAPTLARLAAGSDLIVASRADESSAPETFPAPDDLVLTAGIPVLLQPPMAAALKAESILVGWKNTRESRRAVSDALPLLKAATEVHLIRIARDDDESEDELDLMEARLQRHGVKVTAARRHRGRTTVADDILESAESVGADLIVAGAYGQSRLRELVLGGVTRGLLAKASTYVLFSH